MTPPLVSVVIVNFRTPELVTQAVAGLARLPEAVAGVLEVIVVDNASADDSLERLADVPGISVIANSTNQGFAGGCNRGAERARGRYLAFLNSDAEPEQAWLSEAIGVLARDASIAAVASKVLDPSGEVIDFVDAAVTWFGMGYKPGAGQPLEALGGTAKDVLFGTGAALVVRREVFVEVGGFDERYFMFYEDVDLGWRLNLLGHRVRYVPTSVVRHRHHESVAAYGSEREWFLLERNALFTLYKNLDGEGLSRVLAPALALSVRRSHALGQAPAGVLDLAALEPGAEIPSVEQVSLTGKAATGPLAIDAFVEALPGLVHDRTELQSRRVRSDGEMGALWGNRLEPAIPQESYLAGHQNLVDAFALAEYLTPHRRVLVVTGDPLKAELAGPAIRATELARALAGAGHDVTLLSTEDCAEGFDAPEGVHACARPLHHMGEVAALRHDVARHDVIVFQGFLLHQLPWLADTTKILVADLYDPMHLEQLEQTRGQAESRRTRDLESTLDVVAAQLRRADHVLCANAAQQHFWLGQLAALGRLNPRTFDGDPALKELVSIVPFGLPERAPTQTARPLREHLGIGPDAKVILWGGGLYDWFDPELLIEAVAELQARRPHVRVFFLGTDHPNPHVPTMTAGERARALADRLGLTDRVVFFNDGWVPYAERGNYLLDADLGVSIHPDTVEATFAFRTRILDYLWAGLPVVATSGDSFADLIAARGAGLVVPPNDRAALVSALERLLFDVDLAQQCSIAAAGLAADFTWPVVTTPLVEWMRQPRRAWDAARQSTRGRRFLTEWNDDQPWTARRVAAAVRRRAGGFVAVRRPGSR